MEIGMLGVICGDALDETIGILQEHRLSAIVAFSSNTPRVELSTFSYHSTDDEADLGLEDAVFMHSVKAFVENGIVMPGHAKGVNPYGPDVYAVVVGKADNGVRTRIAQRLTQTVIGRIVGSIDG